MTLPDGVAEDFIADVMSCWKRFQRAVQGAPNSRLERSGTIADFAEYRIHGRGCLFHLRTGREVDVDWDAEGFPVFDDYRLRRYLRSRGLDEGLSMALGEAICAVEGAAVTRTRDLWFKMGEGAGSGR